MVRLPERARTAVVGLGNVLLRDDGVGVHAIRRLMQSPPPDIALAEIGISPLDALDLLVSVDFVVAIDAVQAGGPAGTLYRIDANQTELRRGLSLHACGIGTALWQLPRESRPAVTILGIEPAVIEYGMDLSPAVQAVLAEVVRTARSWAQQSHCGTSGGLS